jgi:hypothetical protein
MKSRKVYELSFEQARKIARSLKLKTRKEWHVLRKARRIPSDIPTNPDEIYETEWRGWGDWLGNGRGPIVPGIKKRKNLEPQKQLPNLSSLAKLMEEMKSDAAQKLPPIHQNVKAAILEYAEQLPNHLHSHTIIKNAIKNTIIELLYDKKTLWLYSQNRNDLPYLCNEIKLKEYLQERINLEGWSIYCTFAYTSDEKKKATDKPTPAPEPMPEPEPEPTPAPEPAPIVGTTDISELLKQVGDIAEVRIFVVFPPRTK